MTIARAQFKLPANSRNIMDIGDFYYFGSYIAGLDMKPISFDRQVPLSMLTPINTNIPFTLSGTGTQLSLSGGAYEYGINAAQALFQDGGFDPVYTSTSGSTVGRKYIIGHGGTIAEIKANGDLEQRQVLSLLEDLVEVAIEFATIIAENIDYFFVSVYSRVTNGGSNSINSHRISIIRVAKLDFAVAMLTSSNTNYQAVGVGSSNYNKSIRYLGNLVDGKLLFLVYHARYTTAAAINTSWYMTLDPTVAAGSISYSPAANSDNSNACYPSLVPSNMIRSTGAELGWYYRAKATANDAVTIIRRTVPKLMPTTTNVPTVGADYAVCTISGMPNGVVLPTPGINIADGNNLGQNSMWTVSDSDKNYLCYYNHNGGSLLGENNTQTPTNRHVLFVFEINSSDTSQLTYVNHISDGFGYSQQLPSFCLNSDNKTVVVCNSAGFGILSWSSAARTYLASPWRQAIGTNRVTFDKSSQIWVENIYGEVSIFNPDLSSSVVVTFEGNAPAITYSGTPINLNSIINVYNFVGTRMARTVRLVAKGCTFSDGSLTKDIETSASADTIERITINGQGNVTVDAFLI